MQKYPLFILFSSIYICMPLLCRECNNTQYLVSQCFILPRLKNPLYQCDSSQCSVHEDVSGGGIKALTPIQN